MPYENSFTTVTSNLFPKNLPSALQQSIKWTKFIKWDWQYYSRARSNFQEKSHSRFTRSIYADGLSDKQATRRPKETQFSGEKKKILHKRKNLFTMNTQNITSLDGLCYEAIHSSISQNIVHISKSLAWNVEKALQLKIIKKEWI